jgi:hypothetical protein
MTVFQQLIEDFIQSRAWKNFDVQSIAELCGKGLHLLQFA